MNKKTLISYLDKWNPQLKNTIKDVYNLINDVRVFSIEEIEVTQEEFDKLIDLTVRVNQGEDITLDIGYRYFRGNKLKIDKGVFVPQYDTEQIIDLVLERINEGRALEVGSGTGAIPIALANETNMEVISLDINPNATKLAKENDINNKVNFINTDYFEYEPESKFDLLISNPPYIVEGDINVEQWVKDNQPKEALYATDNGLSFYKSFFLRASELLNDKGYIIVEIGYDQGESVKKLALEISDEVEVVKDYEQMDRFVVVRYYE